jgi:hypothetical protein
MTAIIPSLFQAECWLLFSPAFGFLLKTQLLGLKTGLTKNHYQPDVFNHEAAPFEAASCCPQYLMRKWNLVF